MASTGSVGSSTSSPGANSSRPAAGGAASGTGASHRSEATHATTGAGSAGKTGTEASRPAPADSVTVSEEATSHHPEAEASVPDFGWASPSEIAEADAASQKQRNKEYENLERQVDLALGGDGKPRTHDQDASAPKTAAPDNGKSVAEIMAEIRRQQDDQLRRATDLINP